MSGSSAISNVCKSFCKHKWREAAGNEGDSLDEMENALNYAACVIASYRNQQERSPHFLQAVKAQTHQRGYLYLAANIEFLLGNHHRQLQRGNRHEAILSWQYTMHRSNSNPMPRFYRCTIWQQSPDYRGRIENAKPICNRLCSYCNANPDVVLEESLNLKSTTNFATTMG